MFLLRYFTTDQRILHIPFSEKRSVYDMPCFYYGFLLRYFTTDLLRINAFLHIPFSEKRSVYDMACFYYGLFYYGSFSDICFDVMRLHHPSCIIPRAHARDKWDTPLSPRVTHDAILLFRHALHVLRLFTRRLFYASKPLRERIC